MISIYGEWTPEADYTNYPQEKMCLMDKIAVLLLQKIKEYKYRIETTLENMCYMCLAYAECEAEENPEMCDEYGITIEGIAEYINAGGKVGLSEYDYYC